MYYSINVKKSNGDKFSAGVFNSSSKAEEATDRLIMVMDRIYRLDSWDVLVEMSDESFKRLNSLIEFDEIIQKIEE